MNWENVRLKCKSQVKFRVKFDGWNPKVSLLNRLCMATGFFSIPFVCVFVALLFTRLQRMTFPFREVSGADRVKKKSWMLWDSTKYFRWFKWAERFSNDALRYNDINKAQTHSHISHNGTKLISQHLLALEFNLCWFSIRVCMRESNANYY